MEDLEKLYSEISDKADYISIMSWGLKDCEDEEERKKLQELIDFARFEIITLVEQDSRSLPPEKLSKLLTDEKTTGN